MIIYAPWTIKQIERLDERQADMTKHPYTCICGESLTAYPCGWVCDYCGYVQLWAHKCDVEGENALRRNTKNFGKY